MPQVNRPRVVVADDHPQMLARVSTLLAADFTVVGTACDGVELLDEEAALAPDVLVVDLCMPRTSGLEAIDAIRARGSRVPVVCLTSLREPDVVDAAWRAGATGYVVKASLASDLVPAIREALAGRRFASPSLDPPPVR